MGTFEIRHNGHFVARYDDEETAQKMAVAILPNEDGVTVCPGGSFELHCDDGFVASFSSEEEATTALEAHLQSHALHVERGGPAAVKAMMGKRKMRAVDTESPGFVIKRV